MNIYKQFQPVTWDIGVIEDCPKSVVESIQSRYVPFVELDGIYQENKSIEEGLAALEPINGPTKFLIAETVDGRTAVFRNSSAGFVELPVWNAAGDLNVSAYYICNIPNTISKDQRSGVWGTRKIEFRIPGNTIIQEPTFGIHLVNDCGRWCFYRYGEKQPFEDEQAYKSYRKTQRFTEEMLIKYCESLNIPVYDREFYNSNYMIIQSKPTRSDDVGCSYAEAFVNFRISQT